MRDRENPNYRVNFVEARSQYRNVTERKAKDYKTSIKEIFADLSRPREFRKAVRKFQCNFSNANLSINVWNEFYQNVYPPRQLDGLHAVGALIPDLDSPITLPELKSCVKKADIVEFHTNI